MVTNHAVSISLIQYHTLLYFSARQHSRTTTILRYYTNFIHLSVSLSPQTNFSSLTNQFSPTLLTFTHPELKNENHEIISITTRQSSCTSNFRIPKYKFHRIEPHLRSISNPRNLLSNRRSDSLNNRKTQRRKEARDFLAERLDPPPFESSIQHEWKRDFSSIKANVWRSISEADHDKP